MMTYLVLKISQYIIFYVNSNLSEPNLVKKLYRKVIPCLDSENRHYHGRLVEVVFLVGQLLLTPLTPGVQIFPTSNKIKF